MTERRKKTAVVVIHGIGEQIPMSTLRGFVEAVWSTDHSLFEADRPDSTTGGERDENPTWSKPDTRTRSFELRRITTERAKNGRSCDFYELYWADLMQGTTWEHVRAWIAELLFRAPSRVPRALFSAWILLWLISLAALAFVAWGFMANPGPAPCAVGSVCWSEIRPVLLGLGGLALTGVVNFLMLRYVGDAARYVSARPENVGRRQEIRERGVALLEELMGVVPQGETSPGKLDYDRIVVVGHSLGTIIGYDILKFAFARHNRTFLQDPKAEQPARETLEAMVRDAVDGAEPLDMTAFRVAQAAARAELEALGSPWIVSDFVTLGAPLAHAEVLLVKDKEDVDAQKAERILPTCPPVLELDRTTKRLHFSYWPGRRRDESDDREALLTRIPHHAAHLAYTSWTNLYSPSSAVFWGDIVSGPVADIFGIDGEKGTVSGISDVPVMTGAAGSRPFFTHTRYWDLEGRSGDRVPAHIKALRAALDLGRV